METKPKYDSESLKEMAYKIRTVFTELRDMFGADHDHNQGLGCGSAGCIGAKLAIYFDVNGVSEGPVSQEYFDGAAALATHLGFTENLYYARIDRMLLYLKLYGVWPYGQAMNAFDGDYNSYLNVKGASNFERVLHTWFTCADNLDKLAVTIEENKK